MQFIIHSGIASGVRSCLVATARLIYRDRGFYVGIAFYTVICFLLLVMADRLDQSSHALYFGQWTTLFLWMMPVLALCLDMGLVMWRFERRRFLAYRRVLSVRRLSHLLAGMALMMCLMVFQGSFTSIKNILSIINDGFPYDVLHADIDEWLHFGYAPSDILLAVGQYDVLKAVVEWNYSTLWFALCFGGLFFVATSPKTAGIRSRYILMFMFVWVVCGNVFAGLFLSAGPVYYGNVTGDYARYDDLLKFIAGGYGITSQFQTYLWQLHESGQAGFGSGISAFPSVHVALVAMNAFFLAERSACLGWLAGIYTAFIVLSSVYLGWHYAIDGYVSVIVVGVAHFALRRVMARSQRVTHHKAQNGAVVPTA